MCRFLITFLFLSLSFQSFSKTDRLDFYLNEDDYFQLTKKIRKYYGSSIRKGAYRLVPNSNRLVFKSAHSSLNDQKVIKTVLKTRGQNCLSSYRKCFGVKLESEMSFNSGFKSKSFNLVSMWQDRGYTTSELGYEIYSQFGLFPMKRQYVKVFINNVSFGLYLLIEKPKSYFEKHYKAGFVGRRKYFDKLEKKYFDKKAGIKKKSYLKVYKELKYPPKLKGPELFDYLNKRIDLDQYITWLALAAITNNGDYSDEVFFIANKASHSSDIRFQIMAWDLDDLFKKPHFGPWNSLIFKKELEKSFLYSMESRLDRRIGKNEYLHNLVIEKIYNLLTTKITEDFIETSVFKVKSRIAPYLTDSEVLKVSINDDGRDKAYTKNEILKSLELSQKLLKKKRRELIRKIEQKRF